MGNKTQYHDNMRQRPLKSPGKRRQRVKAQKRRLIAGGMAAAAVAKLNVLETREALKSLGR